MQITLGTPDVEHRETWVTDKKFVVIHVTEDICKSA